MKSYPSISKEIQQGLSVYAFAKIDGSNIRAEWSKKRGFYKFGSRNRLLGSDQPVINNAENIIKEAWEDSLSNIFSKQKWEKAICFFEFCGDHSFAGTHVDTDLHKAILIDVNPYKQGILPPKEYLNYFGNLDVAELLYHGPCDGEFIESVKHSTLEKRTKKLKLYRPVDGKELELIKESGWEKFPPRLPDQSIFYPVCHEEYARQISISNAKTNPFSPSFAFHRSAQLVED